LEHGEIESMENEKKRRVGHDRTGTYSSNGNLKSGERCRRGVGKASGSIKTGLYEKKARKCDGRGGI